MKITDLLIKDTMNLSLSSSTKTEVIDELVTMLYDAGRIKDIKKFRKAIIAREEQVSTGVGGGVAIPHAKSKTVLEPTLVFGISEKGIDYKSLDGELSTIFFMIAVPEKGNDLHLKALSKLARMLIHEDFKQGLLDAKTKDEVLALIDSKQ
ncbi:FruA protein [Haloplasma contractile SSD-17B]|uniref:FruA protein n=1 Tax=Haloplasma contractile SSD-17B TaxID=1033810 RepID=U2FM97_9MOLU|nr:fructose PTS transporter subunit IIA [Haloplasma contractile]ERJ13845.1 FruA protein [Haloplasma contractile SSD-17B]